ncbi:MAG: hypothetical protein OHK0029_40230 [Armatimonadaceae bacterium]
MNLYRFRGGAGTAITLLLVGGMISGFTCATLAKEKQEEGKPMLAKEALLTAPINSLEATGAKREEIRTPGQPFDRGVRVILTKPAQDSNVTQFTASNTAAVEQGDAMLATLFIRGKALDGKPARVILMFEKSSAPWTKSVSQNVTANEDPTAWKKVVVPFAAAESYQPGEAMLSIRLATQPQTVELGGLSLTNYGKSKSQDEMLNMVAEQNPLGKVTVAVLANQPRQVIEAFGGNFCKGRFGMTEPNDAVGKYTLENLNVRHARIGIPLQYWQDAPGQSYNDAGPNRATFLLMQEMKRRGIPMVASVWDAPKWMLQNPERDSQRIIARDRWDDAIEAMAQWLVTARDKYGVTVDYVSFNEADGGYQIKFTSKEIAEFIKRAQKRFAKSDLKVKWLAGDTANGRALVEYTRPLLLDKELVPHLGPVSFHSWDALSATPEDYAAIATLAKEFNRPVWCLELGHDAQLWRVRPPVWPTWDNAMRLATAYGKTLKYAQASVVDYWEYQADFPLVDGDKQKPYPAFHVVHQMTKAFPPGSQVLATTEGGNDSLLSLAAKTKTGHSVLLINNGGPGEITLTGLPNGKTARLIRTRTDEMQKELPERYKVSNTGTVNVPITARSVTTVVVE